MEAGGVNWMEWKRGVSQRVVWHLWKSNGHASSSGRGVVRRSGCLLVVAGGPVLDKACRVSSGSSRWPCT